MTPTAEQQAILEASGHIIRINARAGTGKTTTLRLLAEQHRDKRILYLVFNRKAREEARKSFPRNVDALTVHALAYRHEGYKWKETLGYFSPADMLFAFATDEQVLATLCHDFLIYFLNAPFDKLEDAVGPFCALLSEGARELFTHYKYRMIQAARTIATEWNTGKKPCPHDFYLKLCHKSRRFQTALTHYDIILVDEGQDLSPIMLDALKTCRQRIVLVGDSHQQIYSFRYAIDAMRTLRCQEEFELSQSFRFGESIAGIATTFIQEAKQEHQFRIYGNGQKPSQVSIYENLPSASETQRIAVLSRSNIALFENAMHFRACCVPFGFERDLYPLLMRTLDVYWLREQRTENIRDHLIRSFKTADDLELYTKDTENFQLRGMLEIVDRYADEFPGVVFELSERTRTKKDADTSQGLILSTIHSAKGQEYDQVYIDPDMAENLEHALEPEVNGGHDEINVAYVGFTRAMQRLALPPEFQTILTPRWSSLLEEYKKEGKKIGGKGSPRPITLRRKPKSVQPLPFSSKKNKHYQPGDKVYTSFGTGIILEIVGEYCLIDLAGKHQTKLRERLSNVW
ncbi:hypothetical protein CSA56_00910 [candidate division KSB3 bacterium]|uniref:DNA 3'-5' helicase n=1 Tax=candidate division KSB3 bacterium TaxID=2044937 RepID=A0A2G6KKL4_9BACT|nr:MAG: hypothetical protein CSA56_00910 [candidate division KSB3 bacterium]